MQMSQERTEANPGAQGTIDIGRHIAELKEEAQQVLARIVQLSGVELNEAEQAERIQLEQTCEQRKCFSQ